MSRKISMENKRRFANLREMACCTCGAMPVQIHHLIGIGKSGMGLKSPDELSIPLCCACHDELHRHGHKTFEKKYGTQGDLLTATNNILEAMLLIS